MAQRLTEFAGRRPASSRYSNSLVGYRPDDGNTRCDPKDPDKFEPMRELWGAKSCRRRGELLAGYQVDKLTSPPARSAFNLVCRAFRLHREGACVFHSYRRLYQHSYQRCRHLHETPANWGTEDNWRRVPPSPPYRSSKQSGFAAGGSAGESSCLGQSAASTSCWRRRGTTKSTNARSFNGSRFCPL